MRKFYSFLLTALFGMIAFTANAASVTINIDDPSRVKVSVNGTEATDLVQGDNVIELTGSYGNSVSIEAKENFFLEKVVRKSSGAEEPIRNLTSCYLYVSSSEEGETWTVTTVNADDMRDGSCMIYVDDASKVKVQRSGSYTDVALTSGEWTTVKYSKTLESQLTIGSTDYSTPLYSVTQNDNAVDPQYGSTWNITPADNDKIKILANYPDESVALKFVYETDEAKDFISGVKVNDADVTNYNDEDFTVKLGSKVEISGNTTDYKLESFKVNDNTTSFYGSYRFTVTAATTIYVDAHKYGTVKANLNIDNPDYVTVYKGYSYENVTIELKEGDNPIEVNENNTLICISPNSGCSVISISDGSDTQYTVDYTGMYKIYLTEGMNLTVKTGAITRDKKAVVYVDDISKAPFVHKITRHDKSEFDLKDGYNEVDFYDGDNPFMLSFYADVSISPYVYKNEEILAPKYEGGSYYETTFVDGDIIKVFLAAEPKTCNVTFDVTGSAENAIVTRDLIKTVENWSAGFSTLQATQVSMTAVDGYTLEVSVDGKAVTADEDGNFTFTVDADTKVSVNIKTASGIKDVYTGKAVNNDVYNLQGVLLIKNATAGQKDNLPAGIYIINGKKTVIR